MYKHESLCWTFPEPQLFTSGCVISSILISNTTGLLKLGKYHFLCKKRDSNDSDSK